MAKATATCTCKKCGKTFIRETIRRNRSEADSWVEWAEKTFDICPECEYEENRKAAEELAKKAESSGMPELIGTEKQVVWAEQIRADIVKKIDDIYQLSLKQLDAIDDPKIKEEAKDSIERLEILKNVVCGQAYARWWIDHRSSDLREIAREMMEKIDEAMAEKKTETIVEEKREAEPEPMVPEAPRFGTALIKVVDNTVTAEYPRDETFRKIVKECGLSWDSTAQVWILKATEFTGSAADRAAELVSKLLKEGFTVRCADEAVRKMAVNGNYQPYTDRWVKVGDSGTYAGWLAIELPRGDDREKMYEAARRLKGSKYSKSVIYVPIANHNMVEDFAEINGYSISTAARAAIVDFEEQRLHPVAPADVDEKEQPDKLKEILNSDDAVLPDLVDDDEAHH